MEALQFIPTLGKVLWDLKGKCDQHHDNKNEIKELQLFIEDYNEHTPAPQKRFKQGLGGNAMGTAVLKFLEGDIVKATNKLQQWSINKTFFRVLNSEQRMKKLEHLHRKVMASVQKNLGIASLSTLMDVRESQTTILDSISDSNAQLKSLVTACIGSMTGTVVRVVKEEVMQARQMSFADQKFWEEVLAAVNQREAETEAHYYFYMDPILSELMIDPVVASNGHTYCRWTIIDNNMKKNPHNLCEDLTILVDNLTVRSRLFEEFPRQLEKFRERREKFRSKALALYSKDLLGDAVVALQYVLQWNKNDQECATAFLEVHKELKKVKGASSSTSSSTCDSSSEDEFDNRKIIPNHIVELAGKDYQQTKHPEQPCENVEDTSSKSEISSLMGYHSQQSSSTILSSLLEDNVIRPHRYYGTRASPELAPMMTQLFTPTVESSGNTGTEKHPSGRTPVRHTKLSLQREAMNQRHMTQLFTPTPESSGDTETRKHQTSTRDAFASPNLHSSENLNWHGNLLSDGLPQRVTTHTKLGEIDEVNRRQMTQLFTPTVESSGNTGTGKHPSGPTLVSRHTKLSLQREAMNRRTY